MAALVQKKAKLLFWLRYNEGATITDEQGEVEVEGVKLEERIAVKTKDLVINRDADIQSREVKLSEKQIKKGNATPDGQGLYGPGKWRVDERK